MNRVAENDRYLCSGGQMGKIKVCEEAYFLQRRSGTNPVIPVSYRLWGLLVNLRFPHQAAALHQSLPPSSLPSFTFIRTSVPGFGTHPKSR